MYTPDKEQTQKYYELLLQTEKMILEEAMREAAGTMQDSVSAAMPKQSKSPPLERRNINSKENFMSKYDDPEYEDSLSEGERESFYEQRDIYNEEMEAKARDPKIPAKNDIVKQISVSAAMPKQSESPPLVRRNINSKENFMSENTYYPKANRPTKEDEAVFHKALHERKVIMEALKNGTLSCLPGTDGYADTSPAFNLMSPENYHGDTLLYIKEHQKQNGYPTAEYITEHQIEKAKQDYPEIALKEDQKPFWFYIDKLNKETQKYEPKEIQVFNIAQTTNPQLLKDWVIEQEEKKIESMKTQFSESYKPSEPKQRSPAPKEIACTSTDPEKYLGQYLAAVSLNSKFKVSPEQAAEFAQKLESSVYERGENGHTHPFKISKIANQANEECRNVLRDIKMDALKQQREQPQQQQEQAQSRGRGI